MDSMDETIQAFCARQSSATGRSYHWFLTQLNTFLRQQNLSPADLDTSDLERFLNGHATWKAATRRLCKCACRAFYRWSFGPAHPIAQTKLARLKPRPQRVLSAREVVRLLAALPGDAAGVRNRAIICLMLDTGLRESEICRLELKMTDLDERSLFVVVKGGEWGEAVFSRQTAGYLRSWLAERALLVQRLESTDGAVFVGFCTGRRLTPNGLRKLFVRISQQTGVRVNPHALRRTFATLATRAGAPARVLMAAGRWRSLAQLETYTRAITAQDFEPWFPVEFLLQGRADTPIERAIQRAANAGL